MFGPNGKNMTKTDIITLEAQGEFPFEFRIEKATTSDTESEEMILEGVASTTNVDHDHERMSKEAISSMASIINKEGVPLRVEHSKDKDAVIGVVDKAWVDERNQLHIQAKLDKNHMVSPILYQSMKNGSKMGFSVGGVVKHALQEFSEKLGKVVNTFYEVALQEVSVTPRPANFDAWAVAKSLAKDAEEADRLRGTQVYRKFLFENQNLDYLQAFAKSIPDGAWRKTSHDMAKDKTVKTESETERDTEKAAVTRADLKAVVKAMTDGFRSIYNVLGKAMDTDAKDQVNPDEDKTTDIGERAVKMTGDAKDQVNPDEKKPEDIGERATKKGREGQEDPGEEAQGDDLKGEREKSESETETERSKAESETDTETKKKADEETDTMGLKSLKAMVKSFEDLGFHSRKAETDTETERSKSETETETERKTRKAESETETERSKASDTETETAKAMHPLDRLVLTMAKTMVAMAEKMEKDGMRIPGFEREFMAKYQNDPVFQKSVSELMRVPGVKKSVSLGTAYVPTKDGGRIPLSLTPTGAPTITKSKKDGDTFADLYKRDFSSVSHLDEG